MVTSKDVARVAGVSQATVSRVVRDNKRVSEATREKVLAAMEQTGYTPNAAATAMRTQRSGTIGVVIERVTNPFYPEVLEALGIDLERRDLRLILWNESVGAGERAAIEAINGGLVEGLIFTTATAASASLRAAIDSQAPLVLVNRVVDGLLCDQVDSDNKASSAAIARYLGHHGHLRVGLVAGAGESSTGRDRTDGFVEAVQESGLELVRSQPDPDEDQFSHESGHHALIEMMRSDQPPSAVFCINDLTAFGAIDAARSLGLRVPQDVWVVGFDDIAMAAWESYDLTTARQPIEQMIETGVDLLLHRIDHPSAPATHRRFRNDIVVRGSTARAPLPPRR